jgi:multidrug resistance efflux pump
LSSTLAPGLTADKKQGVRDEDNYVRLGPAEVRTRQIVRAAILVVSLVGMALAVFFYARNYARYPHTDNAYVQADVVRIASRVSGPVVQMPLHDNQRVKRGDLLIQIDPADFQVRVDQAKAALEQAQSGVTESDQRVRVAEAPAERSLRDLDRADALMNSASKAISQQDLDAARANADQASANLNAAKALARSARASAQAAQANLHEAELQLSYTRILAPVDGWVTNLNLPPGNYLTAGQSPLTMVADYTWRVLAYYKETVTGQIRPGQHVKVRLFPFPDKVFEGVVQGIGWGIFQSDGTANAATLQLPNISPTVNWVRLAQRFPVRIDLPYEDATHPFRIGQTAVVEIDTVAPGSGR